MGHKFHFSAFRQPDLHVGALAVDAAVAAYDLHPPALGDPVSRGYRAAQGESVGGKGQHGIKVIRAAGDAPPGHSSLPGLPFGGENAVGRELCALPAQLGIQWVLLPEQGGEVLLRQVPGKGALRQGNAVGGVIAIPSLSIVQLRQRGLGQILLNRAGLLGSWLYRPWRGDVSREHPPHPHAGDEGGAGGQRPVFEPGAGPLFRRFQVQQLLVDGGRNHLPVHIRFVIFHHNPPFCDSSSSFFSLSRARNSRERTVPGRQESRPAISSVLYPS